MIDFNLVFSLFYGDYMLYKNATLPEDIRRFEYSGHFNAAIQRIKFLLSKKIPQDMRNRLEYEIVRINRLKKDYSIPEEEAIKKLREEFPDVPTEKFYDWINKGFLDFIIIDGKRYFYKRFFWNLLFMCDEKPCVDKRNEKSKEREKVRQNLVEHIEQITSSGLEGYILPRTVRVEMILTVKDEEIPNGETIRCWLPFPRVDDQQPHVRLIDCYPKKYVLAPEDHPQRTIYFEQKKREDKEVSFWVKYEYEIRAFYRVINPNNIEPYDEESEVYIKYTSEQPPHIILSRYIKNLAEEIVGDEENPYMKAWKIYDWITENMTYTYVPEYSTFESISEYVSRNLRGDCGFHAILFIALCRASGIPARWQSGWYANPASEGPSPHDWTQFYVEPYGWLFADLSFGRYWRTRNKRIHEFYFVNIDSFRTIFNIDIMEQFYPPKKHLRSDPVDNQRGEVETDSGNIYYDKFVYKIKYC